MKNRLPILLCGLLPLLLAAAAPAQTKGVPLLNRSFVDNGLGFVHPPAFVACAPAVPLAPGMPHTFRVQAAAPGMPVLFVLDGGPTVPGAVCLAPVALPIPMCVGPCGGTNQSLDLAAPFLATMAGVTVARPGGGGVCGMPFLPPAVPLGVQLSVQVIITTPAVPAGYIVSNAFSVLI